MDWSEEVSLVQISMPDSVVSLERLYGVQYYCHARTLIGRSNNAKGRSLFELISCIAVEKRPCTDWDH
jgi:hypothetical protein